MPKKPKWNEQPCPECKEPVAIEAARCPHCQAIYTPETIEQRKASSQNRQRDGFIGCAALLIIIVLGLAFCDSEPTVPAESQASAKEDGLAFHRQVLATVEPCDQASAAASSAFEADGVLGGYRAARNAADTCLGTSGDIGKIKIPTSVGRKACDDFSKAREVCESAYSSEWAAMDGLADMLGGDGTVAKLSDASDSAKAAGQGTLLCVAGLMGPLVELGVDLDQASGGD